MIKNRLTLILYNERAFTLIELMVVIAIIAISTAVLLPQLNQFRNFQDLSSSANELQSTLRMVQSNAASSIRCDDTTTASTWSLRFTGASSYQVETDCFAPSITPTPTPIIKAVHPLPPKVSISNILVNSCEADLKEYHPKVSFETVSGKVTFTYDAGSGCPITSALNQMTITLGLDGADKTAQIIIEKGGAIYLVSP